MVAESVSSPVVPHLKESGHEADSHDSIFEDGRILPDHCEVLQWASEGSSNREENDMTEFMVWWEDSIAMTFVVESYNRVSEAFERVSELRSLGIKVLPVLRHPLEV